MAVAIASTCALVFALTAEWEDRSVNVDAVAAALPAWSLTQRGTLDLTGTGALNPWLVTNDGGQFSNRPPGAYLVAVPAYLVLGDPDQFSTDPATGTAVVVTSVAMAVVFLVLSQVVAPSDALIATLVLAFGTATWPISSRQLWPHGPGELTAALAMLGVATRRVALTGVSFAGGILVRPPTAIFPALIGLGSLRQQRDRWRTVLVIGLTALMAVAGLVVYNAIVFGAPGLSGGYSTAFSEQLIGMSWSDYGVNLLKMFFLLPNGLFFWSPIVLVASAAAFVNRDRLPRWSVFAALGAVVYLFIHARMNRASGGLPFDYRYPLESLVMAAPALAIGSRTWIERDGWRRTTVVVAAISSIVLQALFLFTLTCEPISSAAVSCHLGW